MKKTLLPRFAAICAVLLSSHAMRADLIAGGAGSTVSDNGPAGGRDDFNTATTFNATYQTYCSWLINGMQAQFSDVNFTFAGYGNIGGLFSQVPSTDFSLLVPGLPDGNTPNQYRPWVDTSIPVFNPTGFSDTRPVSNQDAGGANIVLTYTPGANDPTTVNFIQAYSDNINNTGPTSGRIDNLGDSTPFYNNIGIHGTGTTQSVTTYANTPGKGMDAKGSSAWIMDVPYKCESFIPTAEGKVPPGSNANCTGGPAPPNDEVLTSDVLMFQTFIESTQTIYYNAGLENAYSRTDNGGVAQTWDVLYGGVQWGFSYSNSDPVSPAPEPSSVLLVATAFAAVLVTFVRRQRTGKSIV
jgi:hypothetical protein